MQTQLSMNSWSPKKEYLIDNDFKMFTSSQLENLTQQLKDLKEKHEKLKNEKNYYK